MNCKKIKSIRAVFEIIFLSVFFLTCASKPITTYQEYSTFEEYYVDFMPAMNSEVQFEAKTIYDRLVKTFLIDDYDEDGFSTALYVLNNLLRNKNIPIPYASLAEYIEDIEDLTKADYDKLINNNNEMWMDETDEESFNTLYNENAKILKKYNLNFDEIADQFYSSHHKNALFIFKDGRPLLDTSRNTNRYTLSKEIITSYIKLINEIQAFIPPSIFSYIKTIEFNSDGIQNIDAYIIAEDDESKQFRLAIDVLNCIDENNKITRYGKETIIHETGHILSLNNSQLAKNEEKSTLFSDMYKKDSYLNQFGNQFWTPLLEEYENEIPDESGTRRAFLLAHSNEFVSDYATTNLEEDFAESFRMFVCIEKPTGRTIVNKKIQFFYNFDELVDLRELYRQKF